jgi:GxxExxY protein
MSELIYKEESFRIIGSCMEVHRELGKGHNEAIYKDALEFELGQSGIPFTREKEYTIQYKTIFLPHKYLPVLWYGTRFCWKQRRSRS